MIITEIGRKAKQAISNWRIGKRARRASRHLASLEIDPRWSPPVDNSFRVADYSRRVRAAESR